MIIRKGKYLILNVLAQGVGPSMLVAGSGCKATFVESLLSPNWTL
jgi:hypothetical protein